MTDSLLISVVIAAIVASLILCMRMKKRLEKTLQAERKSYESEIKKLEFERRLLMRAQDTVLIVLNDKGTIRLANSDALALFEATSLDQKHYLDVIHIEEFQKIINEVLQTKQSIKRDIQVHLNSDSYEVGEDRFFSVLTKHYQDQQHGDHTRIIIQDVTERERAEQTRKDFIANASHELRTPLAIINGYVDTLLDEEILDDKSTALHFLDIMKKHGNRLTRIIEEMLIITKLESGVKNNLRLEPFRFMDCVEECLTHLDQIIKDQNVQVSLKFPEPDLTIEADRFYWSQIMFNLIENAIKQNPDKPLKIKVACRQLKKTGQIEIYVRDNGKGIPPIDLPYIFRRFYRVEKHHSQQKIKGTGLGLSIVKRAIEAHHGEIHCDSIQGKKTQFTITLPPTARVPDLV